MMGLNGVFAIIAALGGAIYVAGRRRHGAVRQEDHERPQAHLPAASAAAARRPSHYGSHATVKLPGTIILVAIFFVCFVLYYFINWKYLSELWLFR